MKSPVIVYQYDNYRRFLEDLYLHRKSQNRKFSFRYFAQAAGFSSPNFLKLVMNGQRNLTEESCLQVAKAFDLNSEETEFFKQLVFFNQAKTAEQKQVHAAHLFHSRKFRKMHPLRLDQYEYYAIWYNIPVRELIGTKNFRYDLDWIAQKISPAITSQQAKKSIESLLRLGLVREENGTLVQSEAHISTPDEVSSSAVALFHKEMMKRAAEALDRFPREQREFSSVTLPLTENTARKVKELMQNFRKGIVELAQQEEDPAAVFYLNLQLFPVTNLDEKNGEQEVE